MLASLCWLAAMSVELGSGPRVLEWTVCHTTWGKQCSCSNTGLLTMWLPHSDLWDRVTTARRLTSTQVSGRAMFPWESPCVSCLWMLGTLWVTVTWLLTLTSDLQLPIHRSEDGSLPVTLAPFQKTFCLLLPREVSQVSPCRTHCPRSPVSKATSQDSTIKIVETYFQAKNLNHSLEYLFRKGSRESEGMQLGPNPVPDNGIICEWSDWHDSPGKPGVLWLWKTCGGIEQRTYFSYTWEPECSKRNPTSHISVRGWALASFAAFPILG